MNILFVILFLVIAVCAAIGYSEGLIRTVFSLGAVLISILLTTIMSPLITEMISKNDTIYSSIYDVADEQISTSQEYKNICQEVEKVPHVDTEKYVVDVDEFVGKLGIPESYKRGITKNINSTLEKKLTIEDAKSYVCSYITNAILSAITYFVTFICMVIAMYFVAKLIYGVSRLPVIKEFDKIAGLTAGAILGLCFVNIFFVVVSIFANQSFGQVMLEMINDNTILDFLYEKNFMWNWIIEKSWTPKSL